MNGKFAMISQKVCSIFRFSYLNINSSGSLKVTSSIRIQIAMKKTFEKHWKYLEHRLKDINIEDDVTKFYKMINHVGR